MATKDDKTVSERFLAAQQLVESSPAEAIELLEMLQSDVDKLALFSKNETLDDISTKTLPLVSIEFHLAMAYLSLPTGIGQARNRKSHVMRSMDLFSVFLQRLEQMETLSPENTKELGELLETNPEDGPPPTNPSIQRERKIGRFRAKQQSEKEAKRLRSLQERRGRLGVSTHDEIDGYDEEALERSLALSILSINATRCLDEWQQAIRELPMIEMQIKMESQRPSGNAPDPRQQNRPLSNKPLRVTHITQDATSGKLEFKREEIRSKVFRPGWNQPTMTLQQLGDMERAQAIEREERQKLAEEQQKGAPRRYEELVRDGMEDDTNLVDASAKLDREWDDWKDENPRGSGNKMGDRGDRNF